MGFTNGQVQKQSEGGKGEKGEKGDPGLPGIGFNLTDDGNFDIDSKRLTDLAEPVDNSDAATKNYVKTKAEKTDVILQDGTQSMKGNLDMKNDITKVKNKTINLANGTADDDAVNLAQLKSYTDKYQNNYHLRESFSFYKNYGDQAQLNVHSNINVPNHSHHDLFIVRKEGSSPGFGSGWAWASLRMTNNLPAGTYTALFEIFSATIPSPTSITFLNRECLIQQTTGDSNLNIITFSHDYQTTHSKEFIQFTSNGRQGEITFQFRFYGPEYNHTALSFLFYSRVVSGKVGYAFDHRIFDVDQVQLKDQILYFDNIQMNDNKIKGLGKPTEDNDASNKKYVDDEIAKLPKAETDVLKLDGSRAMTGNLKMGDHTITGIRSSSVDNAALTVGASKSLYLPISGIRGMQGNIKMGNFTITNLKPFVENVSAKPAQDNEVINFGYFSSQRDLLKKSITDVSSAALNRKNPDPMQSPVDMGKNFITNLKDPLPSNSNYAASVNFVNKTVSDDNATMTTNYRKYVDDRLKYSVQSSEDRNSF